MKPELLAPVSDFTSLNAAINAGADSVYFGVKELNMRVTARNFEIGDLKKISELCHKNKVKAYLALNTIIYDEEIEKIKKILKKAKEAKIDAVIAWDLAVIQEAKKLRIPIHLSTQASVSNIEALKFYEKLGVKRFVLARELSLEQIKAIRKKTKAEIEVFVHGAMCVSVSGRCFTSQFVFGRSANRGDCLQPCRRKYLIKDVEEGHELELGESCVMSANDLCTISFIDKLIKAGINAFKIEGRQKSPEYVKTVTECYREAIDACFNKKYSKALVEKLATKLKTVYHREFSKGFYLGKPINEFSAPDSRATKRKEHVGYVKNYYKNPGVAEIVVQAGRLKVGDLIMIQGPTTGVFEQKIASMEINHKKVSEVNKGKNAGIKLEKTARQNDVVYLIR
jgi:putative protease